MKLNDTISHHSPSQLGKPDANWLFEYIYLSKERRREIKVGYNAAVGTASHNAIQAVLTAGHDIDDAIQQALMSYDFHNAPEGEPVEKRDKFREILPDMVKNGIDLLAEQFGGAEDERKVEVSLKGVDAPVLGYIDLCSSDAFAEIKTKAPRQGAVKKDGTRGWVKASIPSRPDFNHVCQVAIYAHATGLTPHIAYVSATDAMLFSPDNCDQLQPEYLAYCLEERRRTAVRRERLLSISKDPKVLAGIIEPDFNHPFLWDDETKDEARALWQI